MGLAKRRREIEGALKHMKQEGQGVYQFWLVTSAELIEVISCPAESVDPFSRSVVTGVGGFLNSIATVRPTMLFCLLCDDELTTMSPPRSFVFLTAYLEKPAVANLFGLCSVCSGKGDVHRQIFAKFRASNPDLQMLMPIGETGHAWVLRESFNGQ
jgi:hypothetical protein